MAWSRILLLLGSVAFSFGACAQEMSDVEVVDKTEICKGESLALNGQLFRWPVTVDPIAVSDSEGNLFDPDAEVLPERSTQYTFYYFKDGLPDTLSVSAKVYVYDPPFLTVKGMEEGEYCPDTRITCFVDSVANCDSAVRWTLSSSDFLMKGDTCSFLLDKSYKLYARAYNAHCPFVERVLDFEMVPRLTFSTEEITMKNTSFRTAVPCGFAVPQFDELAWGVLEGTVIKKETAWADGTREEKTIVEGLNRFEVKMNLTVEKSNRCDTVRKELEKIVEIEVYGIACSVDYDDSYYDTRLYPCHSGWVKVFADQDTGLISRFHDFNLQTVPEWPELEHSAERVRESGLEDGTLVYVWDFGASDCLHTDGEYYFEGKFALKYDKRCEYSHVSPVMVDSFLFSRTIFWDTNRVGVFYYYCDREQAELYVGCMQEGTVIEDIRLRGRCLDSLEWVSGRIGEDGHVEYRSKWTVRDSIERNYEFYRDISLWMVISRKSGACFYQDTVSFDLNLQKTSPCEPYFQYHGSDPDYDTVFCVGETDWVYYRNPVTHIVIDSVRLAGSDFLIDLTDNDEDARNHSIRFRSYFENSRQLKEKTGEIRLLGYAHDRQTGRKYVDEFNWTYTVRTCPPVVEAEIDPECQSGCDMCPGSTLSVGVRLANPSAQWQKTRIEWRRPPLGTLASREVDPTIDPSSYDFYNLLETYYLYRESDYWLTLVYNEGDSIYEIDSVPLPSFRIDSTCVPRFEVIRDSCCGSDSIHWYVYADFYKYRLEGADWDPVGDTVYPVGSGLEDYCYNPYLGDWRPRLHYRTVARTPGLYPYEIEYAVNDTVLTYSDTLRIAVVDNPRVFIRDTVYVCTGSDVDVSRYIDSSMVESLVGINSPDELVLRNLTANRVFPLTARMKYTCDYGNEMVGELFLEVEGDVYLDCDRALREVCPLDSTALHVSTNGRVTWIKQHWTGTGWSENDTLCKESRNRFFYDKVGFDSVKYTVFATTACNNPPFLSDGFYATLLPSTGIRFSDTAVCYPDTVSPRVSFFGLDPDLASAEWFLDGTRSGEWPVLPSSFDTVSFDYQVRAVNGCWSVGSTSLFNHIPPVLEWKDCGSDDSICVRKRVEVSLQSSGADAYSWDIVPNTVPFAAEGAALDLVPQGDLLVFVEGTDSVTGCFSYDTLLLRTYPDLLDVSDTTICYGGDIRIKAPDCEGASYRWFFGGIQVGDTLLWKNGLDSSDMGVYRLEGRRYACVDTQAFHVGFYPVPVRDFVGDDSVCVGTDLRVAYPNDAAEHYSRVRYQWYSPKAEAIASGISDTVLFWENMGLSDSGWYAVRMDYDDCSLIDSLKVFVVPLPYPNWPADTFYCQGARVGLDAENPAFPGCAYRWSTGETGQRQYFSRPGSYWVELDFLGCRKTTAIQVEEHARPLLPLPSDTLVCRGEVCSLVLPEGYAYYRWYRLETGEEEGSSYEQSFFDTDPVHIGVEVMLEGCWNADTVFIDRDFCGKIYFASAFTPNGDGVNDTFGPITAAYPGDVLYELSIFNKNGEMVFHSTEIGESWDGTHKGKLCPPGVYLYRCKAFALSRKRDLSSGGNIWLIR